MIFSLNLRKLLGILCPSCSCPHEGKSIPFCENCLSNLTACPPLCQNCGSPLCSQKEDPFLFHCEHPWNQTPEIDSYQALYLLSNLSLPVIRQWKKQRTLFSNQQILRLPIFLEKKLLSYPIDVIVPIPQHPKRIWELSGSPPLIISQWLSRTLEIPIVESLTSAGPRTSQARKELYGRIENPVFFEMKKKNSLRKDQAILLVDDIYTSGRTLKAAAKALEVKSPRAIHIFCLGYRPRFHQTRSPKAPQRAPGF
jgi:competence protein ComFC